MIFAGGEVKVAAGAGLTVITLVCVIVLLHASVNVQVSVTAPPHGPGSALNVEVTVLLIRHDPLALFV